MIRIFLSFMCQPYFHQRSYQNKPPPQIVTLLGQSTKSKVIYLIIRGLKNRGVTVGMECLRCFNYPVHLPITLLINLA